MLIAVLILMAFIVTRLASLTPWFLQERNGADLAKDGANF